ncbi:MAG: hypothetical protein AB7J28_02935 [Hyphomonadaceae bacterium]
MSPIIWRRGYTQAELDDAQAVFNLRFPPDLLALYLDRRPEGGHDWVRGREDIAVALDRPLRGLLFDVKHNSLWREAWGPRPPGDAAREEILRGVVAQAPKLIPIMGHRYLPETPHESGNPVFSVVQSDIIYYGVNLQDYFEREAGGWESNPWPENIKRIPFWSSFVEYDEPD